jgi:transposase
VRLLGKKELALLRNEIKEHADATLEELQKMLVDKAQVTASLPTICRALQDLNLPRKKASPPMSVMKKSAASFRR